MLQGDGGDTLVKAELDLLEKLLKGFHKQRPGGEECVCVGVRSGWCVCVCVCVCE